MDMAIANLFKHKMRFELVDEKSDYEELRRYSIGRQYSSRRIENAESIGVKSWVDLCLEHIQPFIYHVLSTMVHESQLIIERVGIKVKVRLGYDGCGEEAMVGFTMDNPRNNIHLFSRCGTSHIYSFPDVWFGEPFYIDVDAYLYVSPEEFRKLETWKLLGFDLDL